MGGSIPVWVGLCMGGSRCAAPDDLECPTLMPSEHLDLEPRNLLDSVMLQELLAYRVEVCPAALQCLM